MKRMTRFSLVRVRMALALVAALAWAGCSTQEGGPTEPGASASLSGQQPDFGAAIAIHQRHTYELIGLPGVAGTAVGLTSDGRPAVKIYTEAASVPGLPERLEGIPVVVEVTGKFIAKPETARNSETRTASACTIHTCSNTSVWPLPVPIGVSTSSNAILEDYCFSGTISARVKNAAGAIYALSNNHVYALMNTVPLGTAILQPGLADTQCSPTGSNDIGVLSAYAPIAFCKGWRGNHCPSNTIDAAIALSKKTELGNATPPAGYGAPSSKTVTAFVGQAVEKYGRTTSLTTGVITGIDASVKVSYLTGTALFVGQLLVGSCPSTCIGAGDSGSLLVTNDRSGNHNPVGLVFAGNSSGSLAIANQIGPVLSYFGVAVDGK